MLCTLCRRVGRMRGWRQWRAGAALGQGQGQGRQLSGGEGQTGEQEQGESPLRRLVRGAAAGAEGAGGAAEPSELLWATRPYAADGRRRQREAPEAAPAPGAVLLFPGQGAQWVGMGREARHHPGARALFEAASEALGWDVLAVCTLGPEAELQRRAQVCVLATALAALERARDERPAAVEGARQAIGFSAGELAALAWAGALSLQDALRLAELRAAAMAACAEQRPGGMLTLWLAPAAPLAEALARARSAAGEGSQCAVAAYLHPGCRVVAGDEAALRWLEREGRAFGVLRAARVQVAGAYHCALMAATRAPVAQALRSLQVRAPRAAVWSCTLARRYTDARSVAAGLARLAVLPVRWEQTLQRAFACQPPRQPPPALALGPAKGLKHSLRRVNARAADNCLVIDL